MNLNRYAPHLLNLQPYPFSEQKSNFLPLGKTRLNRLDICEGLFNIKQEILLLFGKL